MKVLFFKNTHDSLSLLPREEMKDQPTSVCCDLLSHQRGITLEELVHLFSTTKYSAEKREGEATKKVLEDLLAGLKNNSIRVEVLHTPNLCVCGHYPNEGSCIHSGCFCLEFQYLSSLRSTT